MNETAAAIIPRVTFLWWWIIYPRFSRTGQICRVKFWGKHNVCIDYGAAMVDNKFHVPLSRSCAWLPVSPLGVRSALVTVATNRHTHNRTHPPTSRHRRARTHVTSTVVCASTSTVPLFRQVVQSPSWELVCGWLVGWFIWVFIYRHMLVFVYWFVHWFIYKSISWFMC